MSGFVKGVVIGVASFAAGFAVLSVVLPPPDGTISEGSRSAVQGATVMPAADAVPPPQAAAAPDLVPVPEPVSASASYQDASAAGADPLLATPSADAPVAEPAPEAAREVVAVEEPASGAGVDPLPATLSADAPVVEPALETAREVAAVEEPAGGAGADPLPATLSVDAPVVEPALETAREVAAVEEPASGAGTDPLPSVEATPVPTPAAPQTELASAAPGDEAAPAELAGAQAVIPAPAPTAAERLETAEAPLAAPSMPGESPSPSAGQTLTASELPDVPAVPPLPEQVAAPEPAQTPPPATDVATVEAEPETAAIAPLSRPPVPIPAQAATLPGNEPLLIPPPEAPPRPAVVAMPGAAEVAVVRRGGEAATALPEAREGVTIRRPGVDPAPAPAGASPDAADLAPQPALRRHAAVFDAPEGARPLGLVLIDAAEAEAALVGLPFAVTIALDPGDPLAPARATAYRAAGHEVALLAQGFPRLADASDVLVTLNAWQSLFPDALALMDVPVNGLGAQRTLARDVAAMLAPAGMGAIALRDGVDALMAAARAESVPALALYRQIEADSDITLRRMIDRAAFEAARRDGVVIAASAAGSGVLEALAEPLRDGVVLAPVSALLAPP